MNEKNIKWTEEHCEECGAWILHDLRQDVFFCEKCGLVSERMNFLINTNQLGVDIL